MARFAHRVLIRVVLIVVGGLLALDPAHACRCAQRTLAEFFETADEVFVARLTSTQSDSTRDDGRRIFDFEPGAPRFGWFKLRLESGPHGWLPPDQAGTYWPYDRLPVGRLAYLDDHWSGYVWSEPGAGLPHRGPTGSEDEDSRVEIPLRVLDTTRIGAASGSASRSSARTAATAKRSGSASPVGSPPMGSMASRRFGFTRGVVEARGLNQGGQVRRLRTRWFWSQSLSSLKEPQNMLTNLWA